MKQSRRGDPRQYQIYRTRRARRRRTTFVVVGIVAFLVVAAVAVAGGTYWWFSAKVGAANERIDEGVHNALTESPSTTLMPMAQFKQSKKAANIILLGSDSGATSDNSSRSDTIMLVHVDPELGFASILSIPRDLWVDIPGHPKNRINAAYAFGGPQLTIKTVKNVFGVDITKYIEVGFNAFQGIVDSLGGVYVDVDRRYDDTKPRPIDLQPGYQLLNGANALLFARYRFDQSVDWGRQIRQQRVIAAIREQAMGWNLPMKLPGLVGAALDSVATNLSANEIIELASWVVKLDGSRIRQIQIKASGTMIDGKSVLLADEASLKDAVSQLLTAPGNESEQAASTATSATSGSTSSSLEAATSPTSSTSETAAVPTTAGTSTTATTVPSGGLADRDMWRSAQQAVPFTLEAPRFIPNGFAYVYKMPAGSGTYQIDPGGKSKPAVRMVYRYKNGNQCLGITATTWLDAPLASKGSVVEQNGVKYTIVGTSGKVSHIWWKQEGVLYFISNTLMYTVSKDDLLKIAMSMAPVQSGN